MREKVINLDSRKQEIMKNIPGFPISCYYSRFSQDTYDYIDWHWHVDFQFCLTVRGTVLCRPGWAYPPSGIIRIRWQPALLRNPQTALSVTAAAR